MSAKAMRASLLASATATSLKGLVCISLQAQSLSASAIFHSVRWHLPVDELAGAVAAAMAS